MYQTTILQGSGMVSLALKWVRLAPNRTNPGLFHVRVQYILARSLTGILLCTDIRFGQEVSQISPTLDKSGTFQIRFQYIWLGAPKFVSFWTNVTPFWSKSAMLTAVLSNSSLVSRSILFVRQKVDSRQLFRWQTKPRQYRQF